MQLINNDMKDSNQSFAVNREMIATVVFPIMAVLVILGSFFISNALADQSPEMTRIAADIDESYFVDSDNDRLAQAGMIEARSDDSNATSDDADNGEGEETVGEENQCGNLYLADYLRIDFNNDQVEVLKLQSFLKTYENYDYVDLSGTFDAATLRAVKAFQTRYADDILTPWGYQADESTGYVYITTKQKINEIYCDEQFLLNRDQQTEIREYREKLNNWRSQGASFETPQYLATYYGYSNQPQNVVSNNDDVVTDDSGITVTETPTSDTAATSATSTEDDEDDNDGRNFFQRLFGIGDDDPATSTATTSTTTDDVDDTQDDEDEGQTATTADDDMVVATSATSTATSTGIDNVAAGVYNGVNGIINFLLSTTFLLMVLVVLILLLIATLIETDDEEEEGEDDSSEDTAVDDQDQDEGSDATNTTGEAWDEYAETETVDEDADKTVEDEKN
jgi:preprotein translocase subunit SecG